MVLPSLTLSNLLLSFIPPPFCARNHSSGVKGHFEVEVFASEPVKLTQLSDSNSRMIAGEWLEATAGGSHLNTSTFKKNPKFVLKLRRFGQARRSSVDSRSDRSPYQAPADLGSSEPVRTRITVSRVGANWKAAMKKDTVGCMIGFYLFIRRNTSPPSAYSSSSSSSAPPVPNAAPSNQSYELTQIYESTFVPDYEASTEEEFELGEGS